MKRICRLFLILNFLILNSVLSVFAAKQEVSGVVSNVIGTVQVRRVNAQAWSNAKTGDFVYDGDSVKTLARSRALISFTNGVEARLHANTFFSVMPREAGKTGQGNAIKMNVGKLWTKVLRQKTKFEIKTPVATISVRGTEYETGVEDTGKTTVKVFEGEVGVENEYGATKVKKGQMNNTDSGNAPGDPQDMGDKDKDNWKDEVQSAGTIKVEVNKQDALVNEIVEGKALIVDSNGKTKTDYTNTVKISCDRAGIEFSKTTEEKWAASLNAVPEKGELAFKVRAGSPGNANISFSGEGFGAAMSVITFNLPAKKNLRIKLKDDEGQQKEFLLKFTPK